MTDWFCELPRLYQGVFAVALIMVSYGAGHVVAERRHKRLDSGDGHGNSASDCGEDDVQA
jgi:hypothetical protein